MVNKYLVLVCIATFLLLVGCEKYNPTIESPTKEYYSKIELPKDGEGFIVLGKKLENPYSIKNMKQAMKNLFERGVLKSAKFMDIKPTHLYIRILPSTPDEINWLIDNEEMELWDHPLDYEIIQEGYYYQDPDIPIGKPTWQYTSVPIDFELPKMNVEILEECYIPEDDPFLKNNFTASLAHEIELEALEIAGHSTVELKASKELLGKVPEGRFRVHDEGNNVLVPVKGVKVRVNNIIKWDATYTDENGFYEMEKSFGTSVYYSILMENSKGFKIWGDWAFLAPAKYEMGYHDNDGHDKDFWRDSQGWRWMVVNNAVWEHRGYSSDLYLYCYPPQDMRIWVFENNHGNVNGSAAMLRRTYGTFGLSEEDAGDYIFYKNLINLGVSLTDFSRTMSPDLTINLDCDLNWLKYNIVTSLTYHECSHASHWSLVGNEYWVDYINYIISASLLQGSVYGDGTLSNAWKCGIGEMWANFCGEYLLTLERFSNTSGYYDGYSWFNPGLLERSYNIVDLNIWEIVDCIGPEIDDIELLIDKLKTKTNYDSQVDAAYNAYLDWP